MANNNNNNNTDTCVLTLPLRVEKWQEDCLLKRFEAARRIYNSLLNFELKKLRQLERTVEYRQIQSVISNAYRSNTKDSPECKAALKRREKLIDENGFVAGTPQRSLLRAVQTPQIFKAELLHRAYGNENLRGAAVTDDASLVERLGVKVAVAEGSYENIKITTPEDLLLAEKICADRGMAMQQEIKVPQFRVGTGFDVHRLTENRKLILCGVEVPYELGLDGHSDADVAVHALMDALLGAAALGDIGRHFPDTDERFKGADSMKLLAHVIALLKERCWHVNNADVTIIAQRPKLAGFILQMRDNLAAALELGEDAVNVKATTTEKLGFTGRGEGIAAEACVSLIKI